MLTAKALTQATSQLTGLEESWVRNIVRKLIDADVIPKSAPRAPKAITPRQAIETIIAVAATTGSADSGSTRPSKEAAKTLKLYGSLVTPYGYDQRGGKCRQDRDGRFRLLDFLEYATRADHEQTSLRHIQFVVGPFTKGHTFATIPHVRIELQNPLKSMIGTSGTLHFVRRQDLDHWRTTIDRASCPLIHVVDGSLLYDIATMARGNKEAEAEASGA